METEMTMREAFLLALIFNPGGISLANPAIKLPDGTVFYSHCLNTYVSNAEIEGVNIARKKNAIQGVNRKYTNYWLADKQQATRAIELINFRRIQRGGDEFTELEAAKILTQFPDTPTHNGECG